ncbi:MAG: SUMF1/EgtB/PvdO family nonheme iron enzyme [Flavobacteriales bacterium]|nr:SUMF1/EgtB/PvdO family nonheme iron enzyme [Flavobacteriales bacterium]
MRDFTIAVLLIIGIQSFAQKERELIGCASIYEHRVFMSITEVSNINYREFLHFQEEKGFDISTLLPDTTCWRQKGSYNEPYVDYYFRHPAYNDYPIVGITKDQAEAFCSWLSIVLTDSYRKNEKSDIDSVVVRLPLKQEWIDAAKGGNDYYEYPWKGHSLRWEEGKFQGMFRLNCIRNRGDYMGVAGSLNDNADVTAPVKSYWPNDYGLYNCVGNVAEMIADEDVAMGGSWNSYGNDVKVTSEMRAIEPAANIGFRYLVEVVRLKPEKSKPLVIDRKFVKRNLVKVDSIIVSKYEVTNQLYNLFLEETGRQKQDSTLWDNLFIYSNWYTCNYRWQAKYQNYPAVCITQNDIKEFSKWMTKKLQPYYDDQIVVDLPTEQEWEYLARGGLTISPYPWGGPYIRNVKGCLLANFKYVPSSFETRSPQGEYGVVYPSGRHSMFGADLDGALACAAVDTYHPNGYGLYNMAGNVRELVKDTDLYSKGGGWNSIDYFVQITSKEEITKIPGPDIGFRFVVRVKR